MILALIALGGSCYMAAGVETSPNAGKTGEWSWPAYIVLPLLIFGVLYAAGVWRMWKLQGRAGVSRSATLCFAAGWATLLLALDSPIHEWSEQLFWVHMTQHEALVLICAPLLALGRPGLVHRLLVPGLESNRTGQSAGPLVWSHRLTRLIPDP